jgi:hypothetical protein
MRFTFGAFDTQGTNRMTATERDHIKAQIECERAWRDELARELGRLHPESQQAIDRRQRVADSQATIDHLESLLD